MLLKGRVVRCCRQDIEGPQLWVKFARFLDFSINLLWRETLHRPPSFLLALEADRPQRALTPDDIHAMLALTRAAMADQRCIGPFSSESVCAQFLELFP